MTWIYFTLLKRLTWEVWRVNIEEVHARASGKYSMIDDSIHMHERRRASSAETISAAVENTIGHPRSDTHPSGVSNLTWAPGSGYASYSSADSSLQQVTASLYASFA